ncbi:hypothetical protein H5392_01310 [Tessaracoccus sp. MC1865]|uniref:hypothetical protein n=1 Tax=Tessaracoccus sp. MC1865 TaxID=2760310 RepID=UPI0016008E38|nr:hypothetical protein [Tessaracoccus sp. MC1865]MBB1482495.1 hypothetical protein [Tessaracoccus sp. MC1865]QTO38050.1 hypothetical protein J7D54_02780 [Tessaracoccus sp. MC1865]
MGSVRLKGTGLSLLVDGVDYWADATSVIMIPEADENDRRYNDPRLNSWWFEVEAVQSTDPGSFWSFLWDNRDKSVPFAYAPHGNPYASPEMPHFTGIVEVPGPAPLGGAAGRSVEHVFTTRLRIVQGPYRVTTT